MLSPTTFSVPARLGTTHTRMKGTRMRKSTLALLAASSGLALALTACGNNSSGGGSGNSASGGGSSSCPAIGAGLPAPASAPSTGNTPAGNGNGATVGVILPETATSARWEGFDHPMLQQALTAEGLNP